MRGWRVVLELGRLWVWFIWVCYVFSNSVYKTKKILNYKKRGKKKSYYFRERGEEVWSVFAEAEAFLCCVPSTTLNTFWKPKSCEIDIPLLSVYLSWTLTGELASPKAQEEARHWMQPVLAITRPYLPEDCYVDCWDDTSNTDPKACSVSLTRIRPHLPRANETQNCRCPHS